MIQGQTPRRPRQPGLPQRRRGVPVVPSPVRNPAPVPAPVQHHLLVRPVVARVAQEVEHAAPVVVQIKVGGKGGPPRPVLNRVLDHSLQRHHPDLGGQAGVNPVDLPDRVLAQVVAASPVVPKQKQNQVMSRELKMPVSPGVQRTQFRARCS